MARKGRGRRRFRSGTVGRVKDDRIKVVAPSYEGMASGYYRVVLPVKILRAQGVIGAAWKDMVMPGKTDEDLKRDPSLASFLLKVLNWSNVIFLERETRAEELQPILEKAKLAGKALVMDVDDHVMSFPDIPCKPVAEYWQSNLPYFLSVLYTVDVLITTTWNLAREYQALLPEGSEAISIPNYIDTYEERWKIRKPLNPGVVTIGWMGGPTHSDDLEIVHEPVKAILAKYDNVVFKCVGLQPKWLDELPQEKVIRDEGYKGLAEYPSRFVDFDIGLIPLRDNDFNRVGKSDLKYLEYSMFGIASVVSKVPAYTGTVHKKRGILVSEDPKAWVDAMSGLIENLEFRSSIGHHAREYVMNYRSIIPNAYRWASAFERARKIRKRKLAQASD